MFKQRIEDGLAGKYKGLSNGFDRLNKYIFNVQRSCYTLIGGLSGSAKTKLVDFILFNALQDAESKGIPFNVFYYSYEIDEVTKRAEWLSSLIYVKYDKIITPEKIKGLGDYRLSEEEQEIVNSELPALDLLFSKIKWVWESTNPTGMYKEWWNFMCTRGTFVKESYVDENSVNKERIVSYIPTNADEYTIVVVDHMALTKVERNFTLKENLDKLSEYAVTCRNLFRMSFFYIQQFNQGLNSIERSKFKGVDISPQQSDFKDSTNPYQDADVVLGLMNAFKMDMESCIGYSINNKSSSYNLRDRFRMLKIIKNRLSRDNIAIGLLFIPEALQFEELPNPLTINAEQILRYNKLITER